MNSSSKNVVAGLCLALSVCGAAISESSKAPFTATFSSPSSTGITSSGYTASGKLSVELKFEPSPGTNLVVVNNTGTEPIHGTFDGVPQGGRVNAIWNGRSYEFVANYFGGDGNDLVLLWPHTGLLTWGDNSSGQLALRNPSEKTAPQTVATKTALTGKTLVSVVGGRFHSLALTSDGEVYAWGDNSYGQLGDEAAEVQSNAPVLVSSHGALAGKTVVAIAACGFQNMALTSEGRVYAWGGNEAGELGDGTKTNRNSPVAVVTGSGALTGKTVVAIAAGDYHNLALASDGTLAAWGSNGNSELGDGNAETQSSIPVAVVMDREPLAGKKVVAIAAGYYHSLALTSDGKVLAWGANRFGALGDGGTKDRSSTPVLVDSGDLIGKKVKQIASGAVHCMALTEEGHVIAWGGNEAGQVGDGSNADRNTPLDISANGALAEKTVTQIIGGSLHSMAVTADRQVFSWGENPFGELGDATRKPRNVPGLVKFEEGALAKQPVTASAIGKNHALAIVALPGGKPSLVDPSAAPVIASVATPPPVASSPTPMSTPAPVVPAERTIAASQAATPSSVSSPSATPSTPVSPSDSTGLASLTPPASGEVPSSKTSGVSDSSKEANPPLKTAAVDPDSPDGVANSGKGVIPLSGLPTANSKAPQGGQAVQSGATVTFSAEAGGSPEPSVQWYVKTPAASGFEPIKGAKSKSLTFVATPELSGNQYEAVFTNPGGSVLSLPATLTVYKLPIVETNPTGAQVNAGTKVTFTAGASNANSVQWFVDNGNGFTAIQGATSPALSLSATHSEDGNRYKAVFTNDGGTAETSVATLSVYPSPTIAKSPASRSVNAGGKVTFTAEGSGTPEPTVQWYVNNGNGFDEIPGATDKSLTVQAAQIDSGNRYRAVFSNEHGSASTTAATLTVYTPPFITVQPVSLVVKSGSNITVTAVKSPAAKESGTVEVKAGNSNHHSKRAHKKTTESQPEE